MRLLRRHREYVRHVARDAYLVTGGSKDEAIRIGTDRLVNNPGSVIGAILINLAISLLVRLITYWIEEAIFSVPAEYQDSEPGYESWSDEDAT